jgi:hypothetical protein
VTRVPQRSGAPPGRRGRPPVAQSTAQIAAAKQVDGATVADEATGGDLSRAERRGSPEHGPAFAPIARTLRSVSRGGPARRYYTAAVVGRAEQGAAARAELVARVTGGRR